MIQFCECTGKLLNGIMEQVLAKQVVIKQNMEVFIAIFENPINVKKNGNREKCNNKEQYRGSNRSS